MFFGIESRKYGRTLRCGHHHLIIGIVIGRPDAVRVAKHKGIAMPKHTCDHIATIPILRTFFEDRTHIEFTCYFVGNFLFTQSRPFVFPVNALVFLVQKVTDFFQNSHCIRCFNGILTQFNQFVEQLIHIGHVEVACQHQVSGFPVVGPYKRVQVVDAVESKSAISQVSHHHLAGKINVLLEPVHIVEAGWRFFLELGQTVIHLVKYVFDGGAGIASNAVDVFLTRRHVELHTGDACPVLPAVVLLLHKQVQLVKSVERCAVFSEVIFQGLQQSNHGDATFVFDLITHDILLVTK